jgi:hypothetical protein
MPTTGFGQLYNNGVKYIKVNRYDSGGLDRSDYLGQLQSITLTYPDRGSIEYPITTIQEQANYYVYGITPGYGTSSAGDINDYSFLATSASSFTPLSADDVLYSTIKISSFGSTSGNTLGFFTASNGNYTLGQTPNKFIQVQISGSYTYASSAGTYMVVGAGVSTAVWNNGDGVGQSVKTVNLSVGTNTFNTTLYLTGSGIGLVENNIINFIVAKGPDPTSLTINSCHVSLSLYNATPFNGSSSLTIFNPDALNFDYNDYNPLLDNAETPEYSNVWMDVDYSQNPLTPVNFDLIISGTANRAFVQDSNYNSTAWSNIRYNGSRTTSYTLNQ